MRLGKTLRDLTPAVIFKHWVVDQTEQPQLCLCVFKVAHMREVLGRINLYTALWNAWHAGQAALCPLNGAVVSFVALLLSVCKVLTTNPTPTPVFLLIKTRMLLAGVHFPPSQLNFNHLVLQTHTQKWF